MNFTLGLSGGNLTNVDGVATLLAQLEEFCGQAFASMEADTSRAEFVRDRIRSRRKAAGRLMLHTSRLLRAAYYSWQAGDGHSGLYEGRGEDPEFDAIMALLRE